MAYSFGSFCQRVWDYSRSWWWFHNSSSAVVNVSRRRSRNDYDYLARGVFANALSGTLAYARSKRIHYRYGIVFSLAAAPGAVYGALTTTMLNRAGFDLCFGLLMIGVAIFLTWRPGEETAGGMLERTMEMEKNSTSNITMLLTGTGLSTSLGFISSFFGIGGGFLYVPALVYLLKFPVRAATATSLFILLITALTGSVTHIVAGLFFKDGIRRAIILSFAAMVGAQIGARLSDHIDTQWVIRGLTLALGLVGVRLVMASMF
jgi:uncharacterized membrane protein YfcA